MTDVSSSNAHSSAPVLPDGKGDASGDRVSLKSFVWSIGLSLAVLSLIGYFTFEPEAFTDMVTNLNPWILVAVMVTLFVRVFFGGWRLSFISDGKLDIMAGIRVQLAWDFLSNVTPSAIGGGPFAAIYMARDQKIPVGDATSIMLFAMLQDQIWMTLSIPLILVSAMFIEIIPATFGPIVTGSIVIFFLGLLAYTVVFAYATLFKPELLRRITSFLFRLKWLHKYQDKVDREMGQLSERAKLLRSKPWSFHIKGGLLTFITWMSRPLLVVLIIALVYTNFEPFLMFMRTMAMLFCSVIMPTPGGSGGIEGLYVLFLGPLIPKAIVAPTLFTWRVLGYYLFVALGVFVTTHQVQKSIQRKKATPAESPALSQTTIGPVVDLKEDALTPAEAEEVV